jgi:hypothetical protein
MICLRCGRGNGSKVRLLRKPWRRAAAVVEFAVVAPFIFFLALGMFEIGRGIMIKQVLNDAARKACRKGVLPGKSNSDITAQITDILADNGLSLVTPTITIRVGAEAAAPITGSVVDASTARAGLDFVSVKVGLPISKVYWISTYFLSGSTVESETVVMLRQG